MILFNVRYLPRRTNFIRSMGLQNNFTIISCKKNAYFKLRFSKFIKDREIILKSLIEIETLMIEGLIKALIEIQVWSVRDLNLIEVLPILKIVIAIIVRTILKGARTREILHMMKILKTVTANLRLLIEGQTDLAEARDQMILHIIQEETQGQAIISIITKEMIIIMAVRVTIQRAETTPEDQFWKVHWNRMIEADLEWEQITQRGQTIMTMKVGQIGQEIQGFQVGGTKDLLRDEERIITIIIL